MYRFLIIEDDPAAADKREQFVTRYLGERGIDAAIDKLSTAFEFIELKQHYDLVFMDIDLPGINGMEAAAMLRERDHDTLLVFVTDLAKYAVKGYEVDALDFIVKPISYQGIALRMDRVVRALETRPSKVIAVSGRQGVSVFPAPDASLLGYAAWNACLAASLTVCLCPPMTAHSFRLLPMNKGTSKPASAKESPTSGWVGI